MALYKMDTFFVSVGQPVSQRVPLVPAGVNEQLEVKAETEALQAAATTSSVALGYDRVEETPSQNRNYLRFVFAAPGMSPLAGANTQRAAAGTHNVANDSGFIFAAMRGHNNRISIDGIDHRDETIGGEFGRKPVSESGSGRDHNPYGFTIWMACGGINGGLACGATDDFGFKAVANRVSIHDLHATILHQLGIDHTRLTDAFGDPSKPSWLNP